MKRIVVFALVLNAALLGVIAHQLVAIAGGGAVATENGDTNGDGARDITDAVYLLSWLFQGGAEPVALAQQGGDGEAIEELRAQIVELQSGSRLANTAIVNNIDAIAGLRGDLHPVAFSGNFEELENVPAAQAGDCCEQEPSWMIDILRGCPENMARMIGMNFEGEDLRNLIFSYGDIEDSNFRNADLRGTDLERSDLMNVDLRGANLEGAVFPGNGYSVNCEGVDLREVSIPESVEVHYESSNFRGANLSGLDFSAPSEVERNRFLWCNFSDANLRFSNLESASFICCDLTGANLDGANLQNVDLRGSIGVNLEGTVGAPLFMPDDPWPVGGD